MQSLWKFILEKLQAGNRVILMVIIENRGSSPGKAGFKMAVAGDGTMKGSIGGGTMEYRLAEMTKKELKKDNPEIFLKREIHDPEAGADSSGMICSGENLIASYPLSSEDIPDIREISDAVGNRKKGLIIYDQTGFRYKANLKDTAKSNPENTAERWHFTEPSGRANHLYIFGGGHVGLALSELATKLDFIMHLFDNRKDINTLTQNTFAAFKKIIDYKKAAEFVPDGNNIYVVIMTTGHKSDEIVLKQFLNKDIKYLGMMGSENKVAAVFENLEKEGYAKEVIRKVHAPIGIKIPSQTPNEIAVSIVAELIAVKNG